MLISYSEEKNRRQVPKLKDYLSVKKYCDNLYCYLQVMSKYDEEKKQRYLLKKDVKFNKIGEDLEISRQTASTRFKNLIEMGLVIEEPIEKKYILVSLDKEVAELIPFSTLRILTNTVKDKVISVYVYLLVRYRAEDQKNFYFTYSQIKKYVGIGDSRSTDYIVSDILFILKKLELVNYIKEWKEDENGLKSVYRVIEINNKIDNFKDVAIKF